MCLPALSMYRYISKDINKSFLELTWKKPYQLKNDISGTRVEGGLEMIDLFDINNYFYFNWLRNCLKIIILCGSLSHNVSLIFFQESYD